MRIFNSFKLTIALLPLALCLSQCQAAVLHGLVLENRSGRPLARARVTLEGVGTAPGGTTIWADSAGQFSFPSLPAGTYLVSAQRPGYAVAKFGQKDWRSPGTPIVLEREGSFNIQFRLRKLGVIAGEVTDENRVALPGIAVYAYKTGSRLKMQSMAQTDDRGGFRISGLEPGSYYIRTATRQLEDRTGLLPTFYGQTAKLNDARTVTVALEEEAAGIVISPIPGSLSSLRGTVTGASGALVALHGDVGKREMQTDAGGNFVFEQLSPGSYQLTAEMTAGGRQRSAWQEVTVAKETEQVTLELASAPLVRIRCEEKRGQPLELSGISVFLRRKMPSEENSKRVNCAESVSLSPGTWELAAAAPANLYVESVRAGRRGKLSQEIELRPGQSEDILLTFSAKPASLKGIVKTPDGAPAIGAPVYVNAIDPELRTRLGGVRSGTTGQKGEYMVAGLAPGRYEVVSSFAIADVEDADWTPGKGHPITLEEGTEESLDLVLGDLR